jgi:hypothetical protein
LSTLVLIGLAGGLITGISPRVFAGAPGRLPLRWRADCGPSAGPNARARWRRAGRGDSAGDDTSEPTASLSHRGRAGRELQRITLRGTLILSALPSNANSQYGVLANGTASYTHPTLLPPNGFALTGTWTVADESLTAGRGAELELNFDASNVYLNVGGTGSITATVKGKTTVYLVSGAPNIYTVFHGSAPQQATITIRLSAGLTAYSFTFG